LALSLAHRLELGARAGRFWRQYTRMRTAIGFLIGVALIVLIGSFVPQQDTSAQTKVDAFLGDHHNLNDLASHLGLPLTQVFVAPLFLVLLGSLYLALGACVLRRLRGLLVRTVRGYPRTPQFWGEWGSWLFHGSFFLLLVAVLYGKSTGFEGLMTVTEGQSVSEARGSFDTLRQGLLFDGRHAGYQVRLNSFHATYQPNGQPGDFVSNVTVIDHGRAVENKDIRVNDFLAYDDVDFYQQDYGWAPRVVVRNPSGQIVFDDAVQLLGEDKSQQSGVLKVPDFGYTIPGARQSIQLGAQLVLYPDARTVARLAPDGSVAPGTTAGPGGEEARNPVLMANLYIGDLGLNGGTPQNVGQLDTSRMTAYFAGGRALPIGVGQSLQLPLVGTDCTDTRKGGCFTIEFPRLRQYSLFHVKRDNGVPFVYVTFGLIMTGLLAKLYLRPLLEARQRRRRREVLPDYAWLASTTGESTEAAPTSSGRR
jgi:cytochrome c biogenesis protein ResB